mmetsp:Transcript_12186/g.44460  ORF Transcript_12186/g.44460 Transcript_12186/m.44460 type:complete len:243 (+) Transcript_12186:267-995(+)
MDHVRTLAPRRELLRRAQHLVRPSGGDERDDASDAGLSSELLHVRPVRSEEGKALAKRAPAHHVHPAGGGVRREDAAAASTAAAGATAVLVLLSEVLLSLTLGLTLMLLSVLTGGILGRRLELQAPHDPHLRGGHADAAATAARHLLQDLLLADDVRGDEVQRRAAAVVVAALHVVVDGTRDVVHRALLRRKGVLGVAVCRVQEDRVTVGEPLQVRAVPHGLRVAHVTAVHVLATSSLVGLQ